MLIAQVLQSALEETQLPSGCLELLSAEQGYIRDLVTQDHYLNLVIPYGRPSLVQQVVVVNSTSVKVSGQLLPHWSASGISRYGSAMILDSRVL